jgi:cell division protein ZipA
LESELRWILAAICVPLLLGIWWWGSRRSRQAPGNAELREPIGGPASNPPRMPESFDEPGSADGHGGSRDFGVPPLEPLSVRMGNFEQTQIVDLPMTAHPDSLDEALDQPMNAYANAYTADPAAPPEPEPEPEPQYEREPERWSQPEPHPEPQPEPEQWPEPEPHPEPQPEPEPAPEPEPEPARASALEPDPELDFEPEPPSDRRVGAVGSSVAAPPGAAAAASAGDTAATGAHAQRPNAAEMQRIVTIRVAAAGDGRWPGSQLMAVLEDHGLAYGRYQVFHRRHSDGRTLFCAASLVEPGTFNLDRMQEEEYRGLTLFAVLPGPLEPLQTLDALFQAAGELSQTLNGVVQDAKGVPFTMQRAEALREDVARFQAMLSAH